VKENETRVQKSRGMEVNMGMKLEKPIKACHVCGKEIFGQDVEIKPARGKKYNVCMGCIRNSQRGGLRNK